MSYFNDIEQLYFDWLCDLVCGMGISYSTLILKLYTVPYSWVIPLDSNRASDGINLRKRFNYEVLRINNIEEFINRPCSVLEMLVALCIRCEENFTYSTEEGDRISLIFWSMLVNLGLGGMSNDKYDENIVVDILDRFMKNRYQPDGTGGLFKLSGMYDARKMEIWAQLMAYIREQEEQKEI